MCLNERNSELVSSENIIYARMEILRLLSIYHKYVYGIDLDADEVFSVLCFFLLCSSFFFVESHLYLMTQYNE